VAGFTEDVVGLSGAGAAQYDTSFTSTAASASIGAGVAGLLKAEISTLSGEDIDQILERTARDAGAMGEDDVTGAGAIDANAALAYIRNNDVQRRKQSVDQVVSDNVVASDVKLIRSGYWDYVGRSCGNGEIAVTGDLHKFTAKVSYPETFKRTPDVWVRWGQSNGYKSITDSKNSVAWFAPYQKDLKVVNASSRGLKIEGYYWVADFFNRNGGRCGRNVRIPKFPKDFQIAYTAVGTEGTPPPVVSLSGPSSLNHGETGTWTASVDGGSGSSSYDWSYRPPGSSSWSDAACSGSSCSHTFFNDADSYQNAAMKVDVNKGVQSVSEGTIVPIAPSSSGGDNGDDGDGGDSGDEGDGLGDGCDDQVVCDLQAASATTQSSGTTRLFWRTVGTSRPARFVVQHRAGSKDVWSKIGMVEGSDSMSTDTTEGTTYRFRKENLESGTHQFRLVYTMSESTKKSRQTTTPVTGSVKLESVYRLRSYPNPVREQATIELAVKEQQKVGVEFYDVLGRQVTMLHKGVMRAQETKRFSLNADELDLSSGTYFLRVTGETFSVTRRLTVVR
jgi:hypothetical protein